jgi:PKD repeat protein
MKWIWAFGDGSTQTILAPPPQYVYHTYTNGGAYNVTLTVETSNNCQSFVTNVINISFTPVSNFSLSSSSCEGNAVQFTDLSQSNGGGPLMAWNWNFGDPGSGINNTSSQQNPVHIFNSGGNYIVTLITTNIHGCQDTIRKPISINHGPSVYFTADTACKGNITHFIDHSIANNGILSSWLWNFGDGTSNSNLPNPTHTYAASGTFLVTLTVTNSLGCQSDTTQQVLVNPIPDALFSFTGSCLGASTIFQDQSTSPGQTITHWHWNFGDSDTSDLQNPVHTYTTSGTFMVILTVTNSRGCTDQYAAPLIIFNHPTAAFSYYSTFCPAGRVTFSDHSVGNGAAIDDWFWTFEPGFFSTSANPTFTYSNTDTIYRVSLVVTDANGCKDTIVDSTVLVKPAFRFTFSANTSCIGTPTQFQAVNLAEGDSLHDLHWNFGDPASGTYNTSNLYNPTHEFSGPGTFIVKLSAWDLNNCQDSVYKEVSVNPGPIAKFTFDSLPHCDGIAVFHDISDGNGSAVDTVIWNFGDGHIVKQLFSDSNLMFHHYDQFGTYKVSLTAINMNGCKDTISHLVMISCISAGFTMSDSLTCTLNKVSFYDHSTPVDLISSWRWDFGDGSDTTYYHKTTSIHHDYKETNNYHVKLSIISISDGLTICDTISEQINVQQSTSANFASNNVCQKDTVNFVNLTDSNIYPILSTHWNFGDPSSGTYDTTGSFNAFHLYLNPGKYNVRLIVQNKLGCYDTLMRKVTIYKHPKADFSVPAVCSRESVVFKNLSSHGDTAITAYSWKFGDTANPVDTSNQKSPSYTYHHEGIYSVHLLVKDAFGCRDTITKHETVLISPISAFTIIDNIDGMQGRIRMDNQSTNADQYEWDFGNGTISNDLAPVITYANNGIYRIRLITWSANNCSDTTYASYEFMFHNLFVPNALSPNNVVPEVRIFKPIGVNLKLYHVEVFDVWGHLIWGSSLLDPAGRPLEGWDGTLNGELMPQDTYVWKISATFIDGTVWEGSDNGTGTGKTMGTVTLFR